MSLLGNQNNDFEKKLKKQLGDTEFKPAESLWSRIDREVNRPEFEEKVEGKVGNYTLNPYPETWEQIEAQLPPEPSGFRRRRMYWFSGLVVLLFITGFGIGYLINSNSTDSLVANDTVSAPQEEAAAEYVGKVDTHKNEPQVIKGKAANSTDENNALRNNKSQQPDKTASRFTSAKIKSKEGQQLARSFTAYPVRRTTNNSSKKNVERMGSDVTSGPVSTYVVETSKPTLAANTPNGEQISVAPKQPDLAHSSKEVLQPNVLKGNTSALSNEPQTASSSLSVSPSLVAGTKEDKPITAASNESVAEKVIKPSPASVENEMVKAPSDTGKKETLVNNVPLSNKLTPLQDSAGTGQSISNERLTPEHLGNLSISVIAGAHYSLMRLTSPSAKFNEVIKLRRQIEAPKIDWSGGFLLDYHINERWMVSSGIMFTHFSMSMSYGTTKAKQTPVYEQGGRYSTTDSVTADGVNNTRIKYSWNEIPLLVTYRFNPTRRFGIEAKGGISYAMLNVVDAAMVGQNNVGLFVLKNQEAFPVLNNSWFMQAYLGATYNLNESVTLTLMPYGKVSLNGMVEKQDWIQQKPYMLGLSAGLRKRF